MTPRYGTRAAIFAAVLGLCAGPALLAAEPQSALGEGVKEIIVKGGICMVFLLAGSIAGTAIIFERFAALRRGKLLPKATIDQVRAALREGRREKIVEICATGDTALARVLLAGQKKATLGPQEMERCMEIVGAREVARLKRPVRPLAVLASVQPLLGLMGTVFGMIKTFNLLHSTSVADRVSKLAPGIGEALYTTAAGLVSAVPFLLAYHYFHGRVNGAALEWSILGTDVIEAEVEAYGGQKGAELSTVQPAAGPASSAFERAAV